MAKLIALNLHPDERTLRAFGWIACAAFALLALSAWFGAALFRFAPETARPSVAGALLGMAVWSAGCSLLFPRANRVLFVAISVLGYPIGWVVSHVVLALLFFGVFTPAGLLLRALGRDPMRRAFS